MSSNGCTRIDGVSSHCCNLPFVIPHPQLIRLRREQLRNYAAFVIQRAMRFNHGRRLFVVAQTANKSAKRHVRLQAIVRGWMCRRRLQRQQEFEERVQGVVQYITAFKAVWRARNVRRMKPQVAIALLRQRVERRREAEVIVALRFQRAFRARLARERSACVPSLFPVLFGGSQRCTCG